MMSTADQPLYVRQEMRQELHKTARAIAMSEPASQSALSRIRCPKCQWQPNDDSAWTCTPMAHPEYYVNGACGHTWNTFKTRGKCPGCRHQWRHTLCFSCGELSPHKNWYEPAGGNSATP